MRKIAVRVAVVLAMIGMCGISFAQQDGQRPDGQRPDGAGRGRGGFGQDRGEGGRFGGRFQPPPNPFIVALDADEDGIISASEIQNAVAALKKLDKNNDGKLDGEEIQPPRPNFGAGGFGGGRGPGGPGGPDAGRGSMSARLLQSDENKDGKLTKEELSAMPENILNGLMERADKNKDEVLDKAELEAMDNARGGDRGGRPGGGRPDRPESE